MIKYLFIFFQFIFLLIIASWAIKNSQPVSFTFNDYIVSTSTSVLIIGLLLIILLSLILQKFIFFIKQVILNYNFKNERSKYEKGYSSFLKGMIALANKDYSIAIQETKKVHKYLKDESLSLLLKSEVLKIEKKHEELHDVYEAMLKNNNMNLLGLRGLMEHNLRAQDFHHAFIYGEKLFNLNPKIDKLYETLVNIISKTNNWQKLFLINDQALKIKIISKDIYSDNKSVGLFEIAKIKRYSSENEAIDIMQKALKLRQNFPPYIYFYVQLLIDNNELLKAKKYLNKIWGYLYYPDSSKLVKLLSQAMKVSFYELSKFVTSNSSNTHASKMLLAESLIDTQDWIEAKKQLSPLLEHKPDRDVCLLMAKIEEGDSNDPQKINSWITRSNFGKLNKIWICRISQLQQTEWTSVSKAGHFNSLDWEYPSDPRVLNFSQVETNKIEYIDN